MCGRLAPPAALLLLLFQQQQTLPCAVARPAEESWPYNLPVEAKYWPENSPRGRQDDGVVQIPALPPRLPIAVRKMSGDEGEKFLMDYWQSSFDRDLQLPLMGTELHIPGDGEAPRKRLRPRSSDEDRWRSESVNGSMPESFRPPFLLHADEQAPLRHHWKRDQSSISSGLLDMRLRKRAFQCPAGTNSCASIERPTSCCAQGETCQLIPDTGLGDVGCCSAGQGCSGPLHTCDVGFTACPGAMGGGCCIPSYVCVSMGCAPGPSLTSVVVVTPTVTTTLFPMTTSLASSSTTTLVPMTTSLASSSTTTTTTSVYTGSQTTMPCSAGFKACPASLGGGCCRTDRDCGPTECPASSSPSSSVSSTTIGGTLIAPVRPTSGSDGSSTTTATNTVTEVACPTGFYQCAAFYRGGCCRVGRDCGTTSCPPTASTTVQTTNGVTVVVPIGGEGNVDASKLTPTASTTSATSASTIRSGSRSGSVSTTGAIIITTSTATANANSGSGGRCANGWFSCPVNLRGGCCPSGYACASSDCQLTASGNRLPNGDHVGKIPPQNNAASYSHSLSPLSLLSWVMMIITSSLAVMTSLPS